MEKVSVTISIEKERMDAIAWMPRNGNFEEKAGCNHVVPTN